MVLGSGIVVAATGALFAHPIVAGAAVCAVVAFGAWVSITILERPVGLFLLSRRDFRPDGVAPVRETLRLLGFEESTVERIAAEVDAGREVRLASFDQENRLLSEVGPIPYFANELVAREQFIPRLRHRLDLVAAFGVVAIRKAYQGRSSLENEALALAALGGIDGVPRIVRLEWRTRVMYQSFLAGENLGSLMVAKGASVGVQHRVVTGRPAHGSWTEATVTSEARRDALQALSEVAPTGLVADLGRMLIRVHEAGVTLGDVKYGNVLLRDGRPVLCDFDWSRVIDRGGIAALDRRDEERDLFNYLFGGSLVTVADARRELEAVVSACPELGAALVDFGGGLRFGRRWTMAAGSGRWRAVRGLLPDSRNRRILDLGSRDVIPLLELLRAGASRVTTFQPDAVRARFARACHGLVDLVDDRSYDFQVVETMSAVTSVAGGGHDLATAFGAFDGLTVTQAESLILGLPEQVREIVVHEAIDGGALSRAAWLDLLSRQRFRPVQVHESWCARQVLIRATRA